MHTKPPIRTARAAEQQRSRAGLFRARTLALATGWLALAASVGCGPTSFLITPVSPQRALTEFEVLRESVWASDKVLLLDLDGLISNAPRRSLLGLPADNPVTLFKEKLDKAARDPRVRAVVLRVNSPGGSVTASDLMYTELTRFKQRTQRPIVASFLDVAASGGYYVACAADRIYASPTTVTGSIGVIMIAPDLSGTMAKIGLRANIIKSGPMKDAGSPLREMSPADRAVFQSMIDRMYARFLSVVEQGRPQLGAERARQLADGRVYLGPEAKENGLVDEVGTLYDAIDGARRAAKLEHEPIVVVQYAVPLAHRPNIYAESPAGEPQVNIVNVELPDWLNSPTPQFLYLWSPQF
ncbi:MAG: signal peptide peptidase SppA [Phycisphaerae bacterium]